MSGVSASVFVGSGTVLSSPAQMVSGIAGSGRGQALVQCRGSVMGQRSGLQGRGEKFSGESGCLGSALEFVPRAVDAVGRRAIGFIDVFDKFGAPGSELRGTSSGILRTLPSMFCAPPVGTTAHAHNVNTATTSVARPSGAQHAAIPQPFGVDVGMAPGEDVFGPVGA